jgi:hypothetical protein
MFLYLGRKWEDKICLLLTEYGYKNAGNRRLENRIRLIGRKSKIRNGVDHTPSRRSRGIQMSSLPDAK